MAILKHRLKRKSTTGFAVIHLETESSIVLRSGATNGATVESSLVKLEANTHAANKPTAATAAQVGPNATVTVVSGVTTKDNGHVDKVTTQKVVIPAAPAIMKGASASAAGSAGYVPAPAAGDNAKFLTGDGTWATPKDTVYTHPSYTPRTAGLYKVTVDDKGHVSDATAVEKADITGLGIPGQDTTYTDATQKVHGLLSTDDKKKLDGVEAGANKTVVSTEITEGDANPVAGGAVFTELAKKQATLTGTKDQIVKFDDNGNPVAANPSWLPLSGGTLTGDLYGKYLTGTWLRTTSVTDLNRAPSRYAVLDGGWIYYRDKKYMLSDLGAAPLASPALTGTPTAPTPTSTAGDTQIATVEFVKRSTGPAVSYAATQPTDQVEGDLWYEPIND